MTVQFVDKDDIQLETSDPRNRVKWYRSDQLGTLISHQGAHVVVQWDHLPEGCTETVPVEKVMEVR